MSPYENHSWMFMISIIENQMHCCFILHFRYAISERVLMWWGHVWQQKCSNELRHLWFFLRNYMISPAEVLSAELLCWNDVMLWLRGPCSFQERSIADHKMENPWAYVLSSLNHTMIIEMMYFVLYLKIDYILDLYSLQHSNGIWWETKCWFRKSSLGDVFQNN